MKLLAQVHTETTVADTADINMSPLIDMVFLLLIFFMVTTVFVEETGVTVQKPTAANVDQLAKNCIIIAVTAGGKVVYGGRDLSLNGVRGVVARLLRIKAMPVVIQADEAAPAGVLVDVIDECKAAGAQQVSIAAERE